MSASEVTMVWRALGPFDSGLRPALRMTGTFALVVTLSEYSAASQAERH